MSIYLTVFDKRYFFILLVCISAGGNALSQPVTCCCDYLINKAGMYRLPAVKPGQTICVQAGHYEWLRFLDLTGAPGKPIQIVNYGGQVTIGGTVYYAGMQIYGSRYFSLTGTGDPNYMYGFKLTQTGANCNAMIIAGKSSDCEVTGIEVAQAGFAGIMIKTDPNCDPSSWRDAFTMYNVNVHHNYVHDVSGEGFYIGHSFWDGYNITCNGVSQIVYPHAIIGLTIHHNIVERSGAEGIQYACSPDAQVHHNDVRVTGVSPFSTNQNNGVQIGAGAGGNFYNNFIEKAPGAGLVMIGNLGNQVIYNNTIVNSGANGIFCDDRAGSLPNTYVAFVNNTVVGSGQDGIRLYNQNNVITIDNNAIIGVGAGRYYVYFAQGATAMPRNNYTSPSASAVRFSNTFGSDFRLLLGSPLIDAGRDVSSWNITSDAADQPRPQNGLFDIGAFEFASSPSTSATARIAATSNDLYSVGENSRKPLLLSPESDKKTEDVLPLSIYPSPGIDYVTLLLPDKASICSLIVYNVQGQIQHPKMTRTGQTCQLGVQFLMAGVYVVRLKAGKQWHAGRFVKQ